MWTIVAPNANTAEFFLFHAIAPDLQMRALRPFATNIKGRRNCLYSLSVFDFRCLVMQYYVGVLQNIVRICMVAPKFVGLF